MDQHNDRADTLHHTHIEWQPTYELGIEAIDAQHRYFANLINLLSDELRKTDHRDYQDSLLNELVAYARFHFISEENLMFRSGYPQLDEHRQHHRELIDRLSARIGKLSLHHSENAADAVIDFLAEWFINHTVIEDKKFSVWSKDRAASVDMPHATVD